MRFGELFSGIGGMSLGLERAGLQPTWHAENDPHASAVLAHHWPDIPNHGDVEDLDHRRLDPIDVLAGGFPCQDVSQAGRRAGLAGERSSLFFEFERIAHELQPTWIIIENVPGLLTSHQGEDFRQVLESLADCGYEDLSWRVVDALGLRPHERSPGVPQRRRRLLVVGHLGAGARTRQVLLEPQGRPWRPPTRTPARTIATPCVDGCPVCGDRGAGQREPEPGGVGHRVRGHGDYTTGEHASALRARDVKGGSVDLVVEGVGVNEDGRYANPLLANTGGQRTTDLNLPMAIETYRKSQRAHHAEDCETWVPDDKANTVNGFDVGDSWATELVLALNAAQDSISLADASLPLQVRGDYANAVMASGARVRRLTPREGERLQGLPDDWTLPAGSDTARFRGIGNAVAVPMAEWIGRRIIANERTHRED